MYTSSSTNRLRCLTPASWGRSLLSESAKICATSSSEPGFIAGGLLIVLVSYARMLTRVPAVDIARLHKAFHPPTHRSMQTTTIIAAILAVVIAVFDHWGWNKTTVLELAGLPGAAAQAVLSRFWVVPW